MREYSKRRPPKVVSIISVVLFGLLFLSCIGKTSNVSPQTPSTRPPSTSPSSTVIPEPISLKTLKVNAEKGFVGAGITVTGEGLPSGKQVEFLWATVQGSYVTKVNAETIEFFDRNFVEQRVPLGNAVIDAQGRVATTLVVPEDYGEAHNILAVVDKQNVAKGGFSVIRNATVSPLSGPVGTPITIEVK